MSHLHATSRRQRMFQAALAGIGGGLAVAMLAWFTERAHWPLLMGSFGSSAVIVFGFPDSAFSKARNVIGAHMLCATVGLLCLRLLGPSSLSAGMAVGLSIGLMLATRVVHPPAGSNPLLVFALQPGWGFLFMPALLGSLCLVLLARAWHRLHPRPLP
ncbi:MAG: HPP family protein [Prosthecobacter sp.]|nr:HPP family protein [Prosthecobacter sp.]